MKLLTDDCPLCQGSGEVLNKKVRLMGYTLAEGEQLDEALVPCPLCERIQAQDKLTRDEILAGLKEHREEKHYITANEVVAWLDIEQAIKKGEKE